MTTLSTAELGSTSLQLPAISVPALPIRQILPWAVFFGLFALVALFFLSANQGVISIPDGNSVHEWVHDARHLLGFPCH